MHLLLIVVVLSSYVLSASISLGAGLIDSLEVPMVNIKQEMRKVCFKAVLDDDDQLPAKVKSLIGLRTTLREMILFINHMQHDILISLPQFYQLHG